MSPVVLPLVGTIQHYAWGSTEKIARLQGRDPSGQPEAELWFGAHPKAPSLIAGSHATLLGEFERDARLAGARGRLPFLMKILAIETPCSIQVHPSPDQAHEGYTRELAAGIEFDDPHRCYVDAYDKPELLCALEPCDALVGFRPAGEVAALLKQAECLTLANRLARSSPGELFLELLRTTPIDELAQLLGYSRAHRNDDPVWHWIDRLAALYPGDAGLFAPIFLQYVRLEPGEAIYVPAGLIHAYLHGFAVEVMGASDNVLRAGLTPKHIDVPELARVVDTESEPVGVIHAAADPDGWRHWPTDSRHFHLAAADLNDSQVQIAGPAIVIAVEGSVTVSSTQQRHQVDAGRGAFVAAEDSAVIAGTGRVYACSVPD